MQSTPTNTAVDELSSLVDNQTSLAKMIEEAGNGLASMLNPAEILYQSLAKATEGAEALDRNMLLARSRITELRFAIGDNLPRIDSLGGGLKELASTIAGAAAGSRRNVIESSETIEKLYATSRVLGKTVNEIVTSFSNIGIQTANIGKNVEDSIQYTRSMGLNANTIMSSVLANMEMMNKYHFEGGVQGLTKMAAQASMLKFDMKQTFALADKVIDPDKAIEVASAFQRLGLAVDGLGNPFKLMNDGLMNPAGLQESLVKMTKQFVTFNNETKSFEISPSGMLKMRELEKQGIVNAAELAKMAIAAADLGERMSKIKLDVPKEDKEFLANIAFMEGGEYKVKLVDEKTGKEDIIEVNKLSVEQLKKLREQQEKAPKTMEDIAKSSLSTQQTMAAIMKESRDFLGSLVTNNATFATNIEGLQRIMKTAPRSVLGAFEKDPELKSTANSISKDIFDTLGKLMNSDMTKGQVVPVLLEMEKKLEKDTEKFTGQAKEDFKKGLVDISKNVLPQSGVETAFLEKLLYPLMNKLGLETPKLPKGPELPEKIREAPKERISEAPKQYTRESPIQDRPIQAISTTNIKTEKIVNSQEIDVQKALENARKLDLENLIPKDTALMLKQQQFFEGIKQALALALSAYAHSPELSIAAVKMDDGFRKGTMEAHEEALKPQSEKISELSKTMTKKEDTTSILNKSNEVEKTLTSKIVEDLTTKVENIKNVVDVVRMMTGTYQNDSTTTNFVNKDTESEKTLTGKNIETSITNTSNLVNRIIDVEKILTGTYQNNLNQTNFVNNRTNEQMLTDETVKNSTTNTDNIKNIIDVVKLLTGTYQNNLSTTNLVNSTSNQQTLVDESIKNSTTNTDNIKNIIDVVKLLTGTYQNNLSTTNLVNSTSNQQTLVDESIKNSTTNTDNIKNIIDVVKLLTGTYQNNLSTTNLVNKTNESEKTSTGKNIETSTTNTSNLLNKMTDVEKTLTGKNIDTSITNTNNLVNRMIDVEKTLTSTYRNNLNQTNFVNNNTATVTPTSRIGSKDFMVPKEQVNQDSDLVRSLNIPKEITEKVNNNSEVFLTDTIVKYFEKNIQNNDRTISSVVPAVGSKLSGFNNIVENREQVVSIKPESQPVIQPISAQSNPTLNGIQTMTQNQNVTEKIDNTHNFQGRIDINLTGLNTDDKMKKALFDIFNSQEFAQVIYRNGKPDETSVRSIGTPKPIQFNNVKYGL